MDELPTGALEGLPVRIDKSYFPEDKGQKSLPQIHSDWSEADTARQIAYTALHLLDWNQSKKIQRNPDLYKETNILLGNHPSQGQSNNYMALTLLGHLALSGMLPPEWRKAFQIGTMGLEGYATLSNKKILK